MFGKPPAKCIARALEVNPEGEAVFWRAWFDGSALPNPGRLGLGAVLIGPDGAYFELSQTGPGSGCNNEAELLALCALMEFALSRGATHLDVVGDSDVAIRYVCGDARTAVSRLLPLLARAQSLRQRFVVARLSWVPAHRNREADALSRRALGLPERPAGAKRKPKRRR